jgi:competence protein ComEA
MSSNEAASDSPIAPKARASHRGPTLPWAWPEASRVLLAVLAIAAAVGLMAGRPGRPRAARPVLAAMVLRLDPNAATAEALEALPAIGPTLARRIVEAQADGPFRSPEDLQARVRGIGPATLARIKPYLRFDEEARGRPHPDAPAIAIVDAVARPAGSPALASRKPPRSRARKARNSSVQLAAKGAASASP